MSNVTENVQQGLSNASQTVQQGISSASQAVGETINKVEQGISSAVSSVKSNLQQYGSQASTSVKNAEFLDTNSVIAETVFILMLLVVFLVLLKVFIMFIGYLTSPSQSPYVVKGQLTGDSDQTISRDPNKASYLNLPRSNNQQTGIEFSWSVWLNLANVNQSKSVVTDPFMHVFSVGDDMFDQTTGLAINNGPGMYISQDIRGTTSVNEGHLLLHIVMDTEGPEDVNTINSYLDIGDIPYNKWFHVAIRVQNMTMDVYINGTITQRLAFVNVPKQNYGNVHVGKNSGFKGSLSNLQYFSRALNVFDINSIVYWGPNLSSPKVAGGNIITSMTSLPTYDYLSSSWFFNKMAGSI